MDMIPRSNRLLADRHSNHRLARWDRGSRLGTRNQVNHALFHVSHKSHGDTYDRVGM